MPGAPTSLTLEEQYTLASRYVRRYRLRPEDAADVVQDCIIGIWHRGTSVNRSFLRKAVYWQVNRFHKSAQARPRVCYWEDTADGVPLYETVPDHSWPLDEQAMLHEAIQEVERTWHGAVGRLLQDSRSRGNKTAQNFAQKRRDKLSAIAEQFASLPMQEVA